MPKVSGRSVACVVAGLVVASAGADLTAIHYQPLASDPGPFASPQLVPGALGLDGLPATTAWRAIEDLEVGPDGMTWVIKGRTQLGSDAETCLVRGTGTAIGTLLAQEGQPVGAGEDPTTLFDFFDANVIDFSTSGTAAVLEFRTKGPPTGQRHRIATVDTRTWTLAIAAAEGDPITVLGDFGGPTGDEVMGNSAFGVHILADGRIRYGNTGFPGGTLSSANTPLLLERDAGSGVISAWAQPGISAAPSGLPYDTFSSDTWWSADDGTSFIVEAEEEITGSSEDRILVVNDAIVMREGAIFTDPDGASFVFTDAFFVRMLGDGTWFARGDDPDNNDWAVLDGRIVAKTGDPVGGAERYGDVFSAFFANEAGDWALACNVVPADGSSADPGADDVIIVNGEIVAREGDQVDLDGDGTPDDAFLGQSTGAGIVSPDDVRFGGPGALFLLGYLVNAAGEEYDSGFSVPSALLRLTVPVPCDADLNGDGIPDVFDIILFFDLFGDGDPRADLNGDASLDVFDIILFFDLFAGC